MAESIEIMDGLHFLRPLWLFGVALAPLLAWLLWRQMVLHDPWRRVCDRALLRSLSENETTRRRARRFVFAGLLGALCALALAGPSWDSVEVPLMRSTSARVVALDLSRSMNARDVSPSRIAVARSKAATILERSASGETGLVVFAGDGFVIAPLTSDADTLIGILPAFEPDVIPAQGSRPDRGLLEAAWLLRSAGNARGEAVLITDGAKGRLVVEVAADLHRHGLRVSVLAVGSEGGARVPLDGGGYLRNFDGTVVVASTPVSLLRDVAAAGGGRFAMATTDDADIEHLLGDRDPLSDAGNLEATERRTVVWLDRGSWLVLALLPLVAVCFRRGWMLLIVVSVSGLIFPIASGPVRAEEASSARPGSPSVSTPLDEREIRSWDDPDWRWQGVGFYRSGQYIEAASLFALGDSADDHYNRGNALAKAGFLRAAMAAYGEAITRHEHHLDARFNRVSVQSLLEDRGSEATRRRELRGDVETSGAAQASDQSAASTSRDGRAVRESVSLLEPGGNKEDDGETQDDPDRPRGKREILRVVEVAADEGEAQGQAAARLSPAELEDLEATLEHVIKDRLGLWRRKLELQWRDRTRKLPEQSSAW